MRRRRFLIVVSYRVLALLAILALLLAAAWGWWRLAEWRDRRERGVKGGVTLAGRPFGNLLPEEAERRLKGLEGELAAGAVDARLEGPDGAVTPEREGHRLNVAASRAALLAATAGARVEPVLEPVYPRIRAAMFSEVRLGDAAKPQVTLMFNVAWGEEVLPAILGVLDRYQVKVTFFVDGHWAKMFPGMVRTLAERGHDVATHGEEHLDPTRLDPTGIRGLIEGGTAALEAAGIAPRRLFAPPFGAVNREVCRVAAELGYWTVLWTADTIDWQRPAPEVISDRVFRKITKGALVLMHPTPPTLTALPGIIDGVRRMGYTLVPLSAQLPPTSAR